MNNAIVLAVLAVPGALARYAYPRLGLGAMFAQFQLDFNLSNAQVRLIGADLVNALMVTASDPVTEEEDILLALQEIVGAVMGALKVTVTLDQAKGFIAALGGKVVSDPQFADAA